MRRPQPEALFGETGCVAFAVVFAGEDGEKTGSERAAFSGKGMVASGLGW
jgi:hypothetical protein